ncbi:dienelactone hydrolase family protein [Longispora urticae]
MTSILIDAGGVALDADLSVPAYPSGVVLFAHGAGSSRHSPRNTVVAERLHRAGFATLLVDLLTPVDSLSEEARYDIPRLAGRVAALVRSVGERPELAGLPVGLFGASSGAAAALIAAGERPGDVAAVVCRGGRPDLAAGLLGRVWAPTLLIVGALDTEVLELNRRAAGELGGKSEVAVIARAGHLFEEPGTLAEAADWAAAWFVEHLPDGRK